MKKFLSVLLVSVVALFAFAAPVSAQDIGGDTTEVTSAETSSFDWSIATAVVNLGVALFLLGTGQEQITEVAKEVLRRSLAKLRGLWPLGIAFPEGAKSALLALLVAWLVMNRIDLNLFKDFPFFQDLGVTDEGVYKALDIFATWIASMFVKNSPISDRLFDATDVVKLDPPSITWGTIFPPRPQKK